jgi:beta-phosphoglucomutase-like phosphatase (HAD superfamily)
MTVHAVKFDLDGTLVHTKPEYRYDVVGDTLRDLGIGDFDERDIDRLWFESNRDQLLIELFDVDSEAFWASFQRYDVAEFRAQLTEPYDDVDILQEIKRAGMKIGIVTGSPKHIVDLEVAMLPEGCIDAVVSSKEIYGIKPKPDPQGLLICADKLGVSPIGVPYVGNSAEDVTAGYAAGMRPIFVDRGEHIFTHEREPGLTIKSLYELREHLGID